MKNIIVLTFMLFGIVAIGQVDKVAPVWDVTRPNSKTTTEMNSMTRMVEGSEVWNTTTDSAWRYLDGAWTEESEVQTYTASSDLSLTANEFGLSTGILNRITANDAKETNTDNQNLAEALTSGNTANTFIDMNSFNINNVATINSNVGVFTSSLQTPYLIVNGTGGLRLSPTDITPFSVEGNYYSDASENKPKYHDGTSWKAFLLEGDASGGGTPDDNSVTNVKLADNAVTNAKVATAADIDATKLGTGIINNTEFNYLDGVTSAIQTQINAVSDSGQGMVTQTKSAVTETFDNSDVVSGGTSGAKRMFTKFTGLNTMTLNSAITEYNQPFLLFHNSATDSTLVLKGAGTVFKMAGTGILAEDGFYFKNFETPTVIALASNEYLISASNYTTYTFVPPAVYEGANAADPSNEVNGTAGSTINANVSVTSSTVQKVNGSYSLFFDNTGGSDDIDADLAMTGVLNTQNVTISFQYYRPSGGNNLNTSVWLRTGNGWSSQTGVTLSGTPTNTWRTFTITGTATQNNPLIEFDGTGGDAYIDNIVITVN